MTPTTVDYDTFVLNPDAYLDTAMVERPIRISFGPADTDGAGSATVLVSLAHFARLIDGIDDDSAWFTPNENHPIIPLDGPRLDGPLKTTSSL